MRVGYFGGSFDPIHNGHIILAQRAGEALDLDRLLFAPTAIPPHKGRRFADIGHRIRMVESAISRLPWASVHRGETGEGVSYTVDALETYRTAAKPSELLLIIGGDSLSAFATWRSPERILELATLAVYARPGDPEDSTWPHVRVEGPLVEISSNEIRRRVRRGRSIVGWVPDGVATYVDDHGLYRATT